MRYINILSKVLFLYTILILNLYSAIVKESRWRSGESFSEYLDRNGISQSLLKKISPEDFKYLSEIQAGEKFYELKDGSKLLQALIPIGEEMQIQIARDFRGDYSFDIIPIIYKNIEDEVVVDIVNSCYSDLDNLTNNPRLGSMLERMYKGVIDFKRLQKGDKIAFVYSQKSRLGRPVGQPIIKGALVNNKGQYKYAFIDRDGNIWHDVDKIVVIHKEGYRHIITTKTKTIKKRRGYDFIMPLKHPRITSRFSYKRWHPILHRYRPHLGVDFGAKRGTPLYAIASGKVIYAGWMRGYGKVVKIRHKGGYVSLYAHMSRIKTRVGRYVKQGQIIGAVGSTGRSTGPHLHLGLYYKSRAINPLKLLNKKSKYLKVKVTKKYKELQKYSITVKKKVPIRGARELKRKLLSLIDMKRKRVFKWEDIESNLIHINDKVRVWQ